MNLLLAGIKPLSSPQLITFSFMSLNTGASFMSGDTSYARIIHE
jgi:hypothetical protein